MSQKRIAFAALGLASAGGYYLYQAGGDPKVAEKKLEHDAARLSSSIKSELPGKTKEFKTEAKVWGQEAGSQVDSAVDAVKVRTAEADKRLGQYATDAEKRLQAARVEAGKELNSAVDKFDKTVGDGAAKLQDQAAKAKGGISSWFK